ncbi:uncharacterized protein TRIADDRAFT_20607 [Trichoplax adhaerens]|uniref:RUN and TBC1 domain-containing protein 3 n=1 Tax=Trichoplax adhaerens TaxID=10228 RepID=B3RPU2_TRIAD|nr:hypothetical protein TRIADDRAFT_20607 [Trichoplax adhaerens]EDV28245.1 hypothetical protein TRIADDRAFT_20607 [Trichoplax adhaerens]|eukprot:XP_002110079.1 hypothetical protein TRIADDRAFT_20607 [Trichoplax adhaerens]
MPRRKSAQLKPKYDDERYEPTPGGPFSALIPNMWPQEILMKTNLSEEGYSPPDFSYDEFGFLVENKGLEPTRSSLANEDSSLKLRWQAYLEFTQNGQLEALTWDKIDPMLPRSDKLHSLLKEGIPHSYRQQLWMRISGALKKKQSNDISYQEIIRATSDSTALSSKQIEKDLLRTMPTNACFNSVYSPGITKLRRILKGIAWLYPDIGYCQGTGMVAASFLLFLEEEDAFWLLATVMEDLMPSSYYSSTLIGVQADQRVLRKLVTEKLPELDIALKNNDIELSLICLHWFLTAFASVVQTRVLLRLWDLYLYEGSIALFKFTLGMLHLRQKDLLSLDNSAEIFNMLSDIPLDVDDVEKLIEASYTIAGDLSVDTIEISRRKFLDLLVAELGSLLTNDDGETLSKSVSVKKQSANWAKTKNVRQTELVANLRECIMQVARHFQAAKSKKVGALVPDYSVESHRRDYEQFATVSRNRLRRARAILDFDGHDDNELGFRKNDIITIISQSDDHCWVGELNGLKGWFPAKFVELLDERSKEYNAAGDDKITDVIVPLVRGRLCDALLAVFQHGITKPSVLGAKCHPWAFIEEASIKEIERDYHSVFSRLVLCKTYKLDEDGRVLTPEEILYRAVHSVNITHDQLHASMDMKFRSLICIGLNEQVLHLWLEILCSCEEVVAKWYEAASFLRSPGWIQIKCELRVLSNFSFNLSADYEVSKDTNVPMKQNLCDMLLKHHLFSWDL